jgi:hypothetical protein
MKEHWTTIIVNVNINNKAQARVQGSFITLKNFKIRGDVCKMSRPDS